VRPCSSLPKAGTEECNRSLPLPGCQDTYTLRIKAEGLRPIRGGRNSVGAAKRFPSGPSVTMRRFYLHVVANSGVASSAW
jgi:hypothetical protein